MSDFDFDLLNELVEEAPQAGFGPNINYGKCTMEVQIMAWETVDDARSPKPRPFVKGEQLKQGEYLQIEFHIDVTEFNPALQNEYKRRVDIRKSGPKAQTDWSETVEPSLLKVFGKDWAKKIGKGVYVEVEDAETVQLDKTGKPKSFTAQSGKVYVNTVPRFLHVFKSKAECQAAREERYSKANGSSGNIDLDSGIPADVVATAKGLIQAVGLKQAEGILSTTPPYNAYDTEELIQAANSL